MFLKWIKRHVWGLNQKVYRSLTIQTWSLFYKCTFEKLFFEKSIITVNFFLEELICLFSSISHSMFNVIVNILCSSEATVYDTGRFSFLRPNSWTKSDKSLTSFPPCYSQSPLQLGLKISISSNSRNLLQFLQFSYRRKEEKLKENHTPSLWFKKSVQKPQAYEIVLSRIRLLHYFSMFLSN